MRRETNSSVKTCDGLDAESLTFFFPTATQDVKSSLMITWDGTARFKVRLNVEPEIHHVAFLHHILFAFASEQADFAGGGGRA